MNKTINEAVNEVFTLEKILAEYVVPFLPRLGAAILTLVIGWFLIKILSRLMELSLRRAHIDVALTNFLLGFMGILLKVVLLISVATTLGVKTTSMLAVLGSAGLAIGLALQGSLSNLAGGVLILFLKPFRIGDFVEGSGHSGVIQDIGLFNTSMLTPDNKRVLIPNGTLSGSSLINYTIEGKRRLDFIFGIDYSDDLKKAKAILEKIAAAESRRLPDHETTIVLGNLGESSVDIYLRFWVKSEDYWATYWDNLEKVKLTFDQEGISIPFPQRDLHLKTGWQESAKSPL